MHARPAADAWPWYARLQEEDVDDVASQEVALARAAKKRRR